MTAKVTTIAGCGLLALAIGGVGAHLYGRQLSGLFITVPGLDKVFHVVGYGVLFAVVHVLARVAGLQKRAAGAVAAAATVGISIGDEALQRLSPGRSFEALDIVAGCCGLTLAWVALQRPPPLLRATVTAVAIAGAGYVTYDTHVRLADFSTALRYERRHDFVRAREHYLRALQRGLRTPALFNELGWVEIESGVGDPRKALEYASIALAGDGANPDVLDTYGWALHHNGRHAEALDYLQRAYAAKPTMFCIHYHLGVAYRSLGRLDDSRRHLRRQLELAGTREAAFAQRALAEMDGRP